MMIKTAIVGYGQMGKEIEQLAKNKLEICSIFDIDRPIDPQKKYDFTTAVEFTNPAVVFDNIKLLASMGKNIVCGTTGWESRTEEVKEIVEKAGIGFVYASNFSIGMRMFFKLTEYAAELFNEYQDYDVMLHEFHHKRKKDSPSGTALSLADILIKNIERKKTILPDKSESVIDASMLHVTSTRGGEIPGTHTIYFDSLADTIELTHRARNRNGLALGAIKAVELLEGRKGFFEFSELLFD